MPNNPRVLHLTAQERRELLKRQQQDGSAREAVRARIVLLASEGLSGKEIAGRVGCSEPTVVCWRRRFAEDGVRGLDGHGRGSRVRSLTPEVRDLLISTTLAVPPSDAAATGCWSTRSLASWLAQVTGIAVSHDSVARVWRAFGVRRGPSGALTFATTPALAARVYDVLGLYAGASMAAIAICAAPGRSNHVPLRRGLTCLSGSLHADATRHGCRSNALQAVDGQYAFLSRLARVHSGVDVHVVAGPGAAAVASPDHSSALEAWLAHRHPRLRLHRVYTDVEWLRIADACLTAAAAAARPRQVEVALPQLGTDIGQLARRCDGSRPSFSWVKTPDRLLQRSARHDAPRLKTKEVI